MRFFIHYFIILFLTIGCWRKSKSDAELLEKDRKEVAESLKSMQVTTYKFGKIMVRAAVANDSTDPKFLAFKNEIDDVSKIMVKKDELSVKDYITIYRTYNKLESLIENTDEDVFPTLTEGIDFLTLDSTKSKTKFLEGQEKINVQNVEHAALSILVFLFQNVGTEVSLYEGYKTKPELLNNNELKILLQFIRGIIFFEKGFFYLSQEDFTNNINWLDKNPNVDFPDTRVLFQRNDLSNQNIYLAYHALNHLFRGFDRSMMEREIDEERSLKDFEVFLDDSHKIGFENELVWSVETYFYLKKGKDDQAIISLKKMKSSALLTSNDQKAIDQAIKYLEKRDSESVLNGIYDKYFLSKIATKYIISVLSKIDWEQFLKNQNVKGTEEIFATLNNFKNLMDNLNKYSSAETLKEKGSNLWDKVKDYTK